MQISFFLRRAIANYWRVLAVTIALLAFALHTHVQVQADVLAVGSVTPDTEPDLPTFGGDVTGTIEVGIDDIGRLTIDGPSFTDPLVSEGGVIGVESTGIGEVEIAGISSEWTINLNSLGGSFVVGQAGYGSLSLVGGAIVDVVDDNGMGVVSGSETVVAQDFNSQGVVTIDGFGSLLETGELTVGEYGYGTIDAFNRGNIRSTSASIGLMHGSNGHIRLSALGTRWVNSGDIEIGTIRGDDDDENGRGTLTIGTEAIASIGELDSTPGATEFDSGETNVNELGLVAMGGGTLLTYDLTVEGTIRGYGTVQATNSFNIGADGSLRNAAGIANQRERLYIADSDTEVVNDGTIESLGGEMEFRGLVTNNNDIIARDAVLRFDGSAPGDGTTDLQNNGSLVLGGDVTITGDIDNSGGTLLTLEDTFVTIQGNLDFTSGIISIIANDQGAPISVTGSANLEAAVVDFFLAGDVLADEGPFEILQAVGGITAPTAATAVFDGMLYDLNVVGTTLFAEFNGDLAMPMGTDFNGDGIVNLLDLEIWRDNYGSMDTPGSLDLLGDVDGDGDVDGSDFFIIQRDLGGPPSIAAVVTAAATAVPEPSTLGLALLTLAFCPRRRSRR